MNCALRNIIIGLLAILSVSIAHAQEADLNTYGCGTRTSAELIKDISSFTPALANLKRTAVADTLPLSIHIVGKDDGTGYISLDLLLRMLCKLNDKYTGTGISFYVKWPIQYINNSAYYTHVASVGAQMMRENNVPDAANIYFVNDPDGTCGYYQPSTRAVAIKNSCAGTNSTTLTHELGHFLGLPHTFYGWEDGQTPTNAEKVTRGTGANCNTAGDGFCDTDADYLAERWNCPYKGNKTDVNGDFYHPDPTLYMSYSADNCMTRFSDMQIAWMQNTIGSSYPTLAASTAPAYHELAAPNIIYPTDTIHANLQYIIWNKVQDAEVYYIRVTQKQTGRLLAETTTADTILALNGELMQDNTYTIRMAAMNGVNICRGNMPSRDYAFTNKPTDLTLQSFSGVTQGIRSFPNPATQTLNVYLDFMPVGDYKISLRNISGQLVHQYNYTHNGVNAAINIAVTDMANGLYFLYVAGGGKTISQKVVVTH
ncbi:MAG: T9SS type A sorting domain-containing protein [Sphingobacteriales bacterium]|nr:MAG: T9SS type A sorting domain-containing protein [Sphingobacteriales bacterium]